MQQNTTIFPGFLNLLKYFIKKWANFLVFIIKNLIRLIVDVFILFLWNCIMTKGKDGSDFIGFEDMDINCWIAVS